MLILIAALCLIALLEYRRRAKARKFRNDIDRFMEWGEYETLDPPPACPEGDFIMHEGQPIDPATHIACVRLAWTLVNRIQLLLRPEEIDECARQFYLDIREHMKQRAAQQEDGSHAHA